jgi:hypothetical protein
MISSENTEKQGTLPLIGLSVHRISMHCNLGEKIVKQPQEPWVSGAKGLLKECGT